MADDEAKPVATPVEPEFALATKRGSDAGEFSGFGPLEQVPARSEIFVGECRMKAGKILALTTGSIVPLPRKAGSDLFLHVNGARIALVRPVASGDNACFKIVELDLDEDPEQESDSQAQRPGGRSWNR
jgi:flagellar motor switch/type III secretory pathway protein FliN